MKNKGLIFGIIIVLLVIGFLVFITINNKKNNSMDNGNVAGEVSKAGDVIRVNYTGKLVDGTVFDSNVDPKFNHVVPLDFLLGAGKVIQGWDEGLVGRRVGDKFTLTIPPEKAYGDRNMGVIPANSTLIFDVEILEINPQLNGEGNSLVNPEL